MSENRTNNQPSTDELLAKYGWTVENEGWGWYAKDISEHLKLRITDNVQDHPYSFLFRVAIQARDFKAGIAGPIQEFKELESALNYGEQLIKDIQYALGNRAGVDVLNSKSSKFELVFELMDHPEKYQQQPKEEIYSNTNLSIY